MPAQSHVRITALAAVAVALILPASIALAPRVRLVCRAQCELPPGAPHSLYQSQFRAGLLAQDRDLRKILAAASETSGSLARLSSICRGLMELTTRSPRPAAPSSAAPAGGTDAAEAFLEPWRAGDQSRSMTRALAVRELAIGAGLPARLAVASGAGEPPGRELAGIEVWLPGPGTWAFVDCETGSLFGRPGRPLSLVEIRDELAAGRAVDPASLPTPANLERSGAGVFPGNPASPPQVWVCLDRSTSAYPAETGWGLLDVGESPFSWRLCASLTMAGEALRGVLPPGLSPWWAVLGWVCALLGLGLLPPVLRRAGRVAALRGAARPGHPRQTAALTSRVLIAVPLVAATLGALLPGEPVPYLERIGKSRLSLPPEHPQGLTLAPAPRFLSDFSDLAPLVQQVSALTDEFERLGLASQTIRGRLRLMPAHRRRVEARGARPRITPETYERAVQGGPAPSHLQVAWLVGQVLLASATPCRIVVTEQAPPMAANPFFGLEVWSKRQWDWVVADPVKGVLFNEPNREFLSLAEACRIVAAGGTFGITTLAEIVPANIREARPEWLFAPPRAIWIPLEGDGRTGPDRDPRWGLLDGRDRLSTRWVPVELAGRTNELLDPVLPSHPRSPRGWLMMVALLSAISGCAISAARSRIPIPLEAGRLAALLCKQLLAPPIRLAGSLADRAAAMWARAESSPRCASSPDEEAGPPELSGPRPRKPSRWQLAALVTAGAVLLLVQAATAFPMIEEDAYISLRVARNLAAGQGLTYNAGERGVEGFSNILWVLAIAVGCQALMDPVRIALWLGVAIALAHLTLLARAGRQRGPWSWVPAILLATNTGFGHYVTSGLETGLAAFLVTAVGWSWASESVDDPAGARRTSLLCLLLAMARPDGWFLFLGISAFRLLSHRAVPRARTLRSWLLPFAVLFALFTLLRWLAFGEVVPHVYHARMLAGRGDAWSRLWPGVQYLAAGLAGNLAAGLGVAGMVCAWRSRATARLAAVVAIQWTLIVLVGGDAEHMPFHRFLLPTLGLLGLLGQSFLQCLGGATAGRRMAAWTLSFALAGNAVFLGQSAQGDPEVTLNPLTAALADPASRGRQALLDGRDFLVSGRAPGQNFFDGQVSRHLSRGFSTEGELICFQAGLMAYEWPGRFVDFLGLATPVPSLVAGVREPRWLLLNPEMIAPYRRPLRLAGYQAVRLYRRPYPRKDELDFWYVVLSRTSRDGLSLAGDELFTRDGAFAWWRLPAERQVVLSGAARDEPGFDGETPSSR